MSEKKSESGKKAGCQNPRKHVYLLPNLLTTASLFCGFYAIVSASRNHFVHASIAIFAAMILDGLDGRVARLTNTQSEFGKQYDSISDMVCFGVAPAMVVYEWSLSGLAVYGEVMGKISWLGAFIYTVCAALRLARFNILPPTADKSYFWGLASPAAAALLAGGVWLGQDVGLDRQHLSVALGSLFVTLCAGLLMVSNICYHSFKKVDRMNQISFLAYVALVLALSLVLMAPHYVLFTLAALYALSGPVVWLRKRYRQRYRHCSSEREGEEGECSGEHQDDLLSDEDAAV